MTSSSKPDLLATSITRTKQHARWSVFYMWIASAIWIFWFGGVTFYMAVVVPIGGRVLGPETQGQVTRHVTRVINGVAIPVGCILAIQAKWLRSRLFAIMTATHFVILILLFITHRDLALRLDQLPATLLREWSFYGVHRLYLWMTTVQWLNALAAHLLWVSHLARVRGAG